MNDRARRARTWIRWSLRDLRHRAILVVAIALLLALGTGLYTGLGSMESWRVASNDASFAQLGVHDLRVELSDGSFVERGRLTGVADGMEAVAAAEERLIAPTQVDASSGDDTILVPGKLVGVDVRGGGPLVDGLAAAEGRNLAPTDAGTAVVMLDQSFADGRGLPSAGDALVGGVPVRYVGHAQSPEYFVVTEGDAGLQGPGGFAIVFAPLEDAQRLAGRGAVVNDLVLRVAPGVPPAEAARELRSRLDEELPGVGATITTTEEIPAHRILYRDAENDQLLMNIFAVLVLLGAALAAFNLISRVVESQRREFGISMALGTPVGRIALRPALLGAQIAVLGTALGIVAGLGVSAALRNILEDQLYLPTVETPFEPEVFARGAAVSIAVVVVATAYPVWRGVRVDPVDAIRPSIRGGRRAGLVTLAKRVRVPGGSLAQVPLRAVLRNPRRTAMTAGGIAAVIAVIVALLGTLAVFQDMVDRSERAAIGPTPERIIVTLDGLYPNRGGPVAAVESSPAVDAAEPWLRVAGRLATDRDEFDVLLGTVAPDAELWQPVAVSGEFGPRQPGILIAATAADDLGVGVGDTVRLTHPAAGTGDGFRLATTILPVAGTHPDPLRGLVYVDAGLAEDLGLEGFANAVNVTPALGRSAADVTRALTGTPGVASVEAAVAPTEALQEAIDQYVALLLVPVGIAIVLALLIGFNSTAIGADERQREHATMFAFGIRPRAVVLLACAESTIVGLLGTAAGVGLGTALLWWIVHFQFPDVLPEVGGRVVLSPESLAAAVVAGVLIVGIAPLLTLRRLRRADVPSALRVME